MPDYFHKDELVPSEVEYGAGAHYPRLLLTLDYAGPNMLNQNAFPHWMSDNLARGGARTGPGQLVAQLEPARDEAPGWDAAVEVLLHDCIQRRR